MSVLSTSTLILTCFAGAASAQYGYPYYNRHRLAGGAIAGIVIACAAGLFLLLVLCMMVSRRRRGAQTFLPGPGGGFMRINRPMGGNNINQGAYSQGAYNQSPYGGNAGYQQGYQQSGPGPQMQSSYKAPEGSPVPPPYPGKETYPGQPMGNGAPQPGGFAPPPGPPPPAPVHSNDGRGRYGWFGNNQ